MKLKKKVIKSILILALALVSLCTLFACGEEAEIVAKTEYTVVKVGEEVTLPDLKATDTSGKTYETKVIVTDKNGGEIKVTDGKFIAESEGKYTAKYTYKKSEPFIFSVYAFSDGAEFEFVLDNFKPIESIEWNTQVCLDILNVKSRITGKIFQAQPIVTANGKNVEISSNVFIPNSLGEYTVTYKYDNSEYSYKTECILTKEPKIYLKNSANVKPKYGEDFLLPYYSVVYPESLIKNVYFEVYEYGDKNSPVELTGVNGNRFTISTVRNYTYSITVEYLDGLGQDKTYNRDFIIEREYNDIIDRLDAFVDGDTVKWQDRNQVIDQEFGKNNYYDVIGYEISTDDGKTFVDCGTKLEYKLSVSKMISVIVREKREYQGEEHSKNLVALSSTLYYDGASNKSVVSSFDNPLYEKTLSYNSFSGYEWENKNVMTYSVQSEMDGKVGVLNINSSGWTGLKIDFAKTFVLKPNDTLGITLKFIPLVVDEEKHVYENSNVYLVQYGNGEDYPHVIGFNLFDAGLVANEWCTVHVDVENVLNESVGNVIKGIELIIINGGNLLVDQINYYQSEEYNTFDNVYNVGQVGFSGAKYDENVENPSEDIKNRYYYFGQEEAGSRNVEILEDGFNNSTSGVLKFSYDKYGSIGIRFSNPQAVTDNLVVDIVYYYLPNDNMKFYASGYGKDGLGLDLTDLAKTEEWTHMLVKPTELGYEIGEIIDGIDLYLSYGKGVIYIDQISYFEQASLSDGKVASFDYDYYSSNLLATGALWSEEQTEYATLKNAYHYYFSNSEPNYNVEKVKYGIEKDGYDGSDGGVLKVTYDKFGSIGIKFMENAVVTETTVVTIKLFYNDTYLYMSKFGTDGLGVIREDLTLYEWIDVSIRAVELGYSVGDVIDGIDLYFGENDGIVYVDYITVENS